MKFLLGLLLLLIALNSAQASDAGSYGGFFCKSETSSMAIALAWKESNERGSSVASKQTDCIRLQAEGRNNRSLRSWTRGHESIGLFSVELNVMGTWQTMFYLKPVIVA